MAACCNFLLTKILCCRSSTVETTDSDDELIDPNNFDVIGNLPIEIAIMIFGMLDPNAMFAAMRVSRTWHQLYATSGPLKLGLRRKVFRRRMKNTEVILNVDENGQVVSWCRRYTST